MAHAAVLQRVAQRMQKEGCRRLSIRLHKRGGEVPSVQGTHCGLHLSLPPDWGKWPRVKFIAIAVTQASAIITS